MPLKKFTDLEVGEKIRKVREGLGLSQEAFGAKLFEYSQGAVNEWEKGRVPHAIIIREIANMAEVSTDELLGLPAKKCMDSELLSDLKALVRKYDVEPADPSGVLIGMVRHGITTQKNRENAVGGSAKPDDQTETRDKKGTPGSTEKS